MKPGENSTLPPVLCVDIGHLGLGRKTVHGDVFDQELLQRGCDCAWHFIILYKLFMVGASSLLGQEVPRSHYVFRGRMIFASAAFAIRVLSFGIAVSGTVAIAGENKQMQQATSSTDTQALRDIIERTPWAFAARIGDLKARAELCLVPLDRYESVTRDARALLPDEYRKIGRDPGDIELDIARGRDFILEMHKLNPKWPPGVPSCLGFMSFVADLRCWILIAQGKSKKDCPPLPPPETLGWQDRPPSSPIQ